MIQIEMFLEGEIDKQQEKNITTRKIRYRQIFTLLFGVILISFLLVGCNPSNQNETSHRTRGIVTRVEEGKDGVQVELETKNGIYNVTISVIQAEFTGDYEQIKIGAEIEVTGQLLDGMEPPLLVAEKVTVLRNQE